MANEKIQLFGMSPPVNADEIAYGSGTVADALSGIGVKVWQYTRNLSGQETVQVDLPVNVFAFNFIFSNANGFCDNYTHFGVSIGARHLVLRNSASAVGVYICLSSSGELITNTTASGVQMMLQALYLEK